MQLRRFTDDGLRRFQEFIDSCNGKQTSSYPEGILEDPQCSVVVEPAIEIEQIPFKSRFELGQYLHERFATTESHPGQTDKALWSWLACFYFPVICQRKGGAWKPGKFPRWVLQGTDFRLYYRHLVAGPCFIYHAYRTNPEQALAVLCQEPGSPGDLVEQLASRQQFITNPGIIGAATSLFVNPETRRARRNAGSKCRRFIKVLKQFDVTWDLSILTANELKALLPTEFSPADQ